MLCKLLCEQLNPIFVILQLILKHSFEILMQISPKVKLVVYNSFCNLKKGIQFIFENHS